MSGQFSYSQGASGFDQTFGIPMRQFIPSLLQMAHVSAGQRVLDVATGTGAAAEEVLKIVGATGHVTAVDKEAAMLDVVRQRLGGFTNVAIVAGDAEDLRLPGSSFDAVVCSMALHIFRERQRALAGIRRALRNGGRVAASVNTTGEKSLTGGIRKLLMQYLPPGRSAAIREYWEHHYGLGDPERLRTLFADAGFVEIKTAVERRSFSYPSFDVYFAPFESGGGPWGAEFAELPTDIQKAVRDERCRELGGENGGPVTLVVEIAYCAGRKLT